MWNGGSTACPSATRMTLLLVRVVPVTHHTAVVGVSGAGHVSSLSRSGP